MTPTKEQFDYLKAATNYKFNTALKGEEFTDRSTSAKLFLPAAGSRDNKGWGSAAGGGGYYWSRTASELNKGFCVFFYEADFIIFSWNRDVGQAIRCVKAAP